jgi:hypothetical protein
METQDQRLRAESVSVREECIVTEKPPIYQDEQG